MEIDLPDNMQDKHYPLISVLISVYNQLHCLEKSLQSALNQDYANIEIIIGDDVSQDGDVAGFLTQFEDNRITYVKNPSNLGANLNYKTMLTKHSSGKYAVVLNADDYWIDQNFLSKAVELFGTHDEVSLVFGEIAVLISEKKLLVEDQMNKNLPEIIDGNEFFINYYKGFSLPHLACVYDRQKAIDLDFYSNDVVSSDWESLLKIVHGHKIGHITSSVGVLTRHTNNYTKETNINQLKKADSYIFNLYYFALDKGQIEKSLVDRWLKKMLHRHHVKWLIKLYFLDEIKVKEYYQFIKDERKETYRAIRSDMRYWGFKIMRRFPNLIIFLFTKVFKNGSFIIDLINYKNSHARGV